MTDKPKLRIVKSPERHFKIDVCIPTKSVAISDETYTMTIPFETWIEIGEFMNRTIQKSLNPKEKL